MSRAMALFFAGLVLAGCGSSVSTRPHEGRSASAALNVLHSDRIKRSEDSIPPLFIDSDSSISANGIWIPEPDDHAHALVFPEQVRILCDKGTTDCIEMKNSFIALGNIITVKGPEETLWPIKSWDKNSLLAEYGPWPQFQPGPEKCQKHVLSVVFASRTVITSDIPTHSNGCEAFKETNSYRLASGAYNVDTSPNNDAIKDTTTRK